MYTDEDLDQAVEQGIFTNTAVAQFRKQWALSKHTVSADEENIRLISSFNDIFVVIACVLLLFSSWWVFKSSSQSVALLVFVGLSWGLAEFFVRKRQLALPAIVLLLSFVGGVFALCLSVLGSLDSWDEAEGSVIISAAIAVVSAYCHWWRFAVPITVAAGTAAAVGFVVALLLFNFPEVRQWWLALLFVCGVLTFSLAMFWDSSDVQRVTRRSDVAFWLHLLSAPLIIHPVFSHLGILQGNESITSMVVIIVLYVLMTAISIAVDRRAFMVSSLMYVLYALSNLLEAYGVVGYSFALTGVVIGTALLLLSAFWHKARVMLVGMLPKAIRVYLPVVETP